MAKERTRLTLDLEELFPGDTIQVGSQTVPILPLGLFQLTLVSKKLKAFTAELIKEGVNWDNYSQPENMLKLAVVVLEKFPELLEECSNIAQEDLNQLPIEVVVEIVDKVVEVNMKSKDTLEKNFMSLAGKLNLMTPQKKS